MASTYEIRFIDKFGPGAIDRDAESEAHAVALTVADYPSSHDHVVREIYSIQYVTGANR